MNFILEWVKGSSVWLIVIAALLAAIGVQQVRVSGLQVDLAQEKQGRSEDVAQSLRTAQAWQAYLDGVRTQHAEDQQRKENEYVAKQNKREAARLAAIADADRLRGKLAAFIGAGMQPGDTCAVAYQRAADRLGIVGGLLGEAISLAAESRSIIERRDDEVGNLLQQIRIDRAACMPSQ